MTTKETSTQPSSTPTPHHERLAVFLGDWNITGRNSDHAPDGPGNPVSGDEQGEWLPGGFFVTLRWNHDYGTSQHQGLGVIGYDEAKQSYYTQNFDNLNYVRRYEITHEGDQWTFSGEQERATYTFSDNGNTCTQLWEISKDGTEWLPLCEMTGTKNV